MASRFRHGVMIGLVAMHFSGCALLGPICLSKQKRTPVTTITGYAAPGSLGFYRVSYNRAGIQNDLSLVWTGQSDPTPPLLNMYATGVDCEHFDPKQLSRPRGDACALVAIGHNTANLMRPGLIITHGRGNPEKLGPNAEYKLWIVGDPELPAYYRVSITAFYGPDC